MPHEFDRDYWERHWRDAGSAGAGAAHPYLAVETADLVPGTALDAGCGEGSEALWLAEHGWTVTGADISAEALARARERAAGSTAQSQVHWVQADLEVWAPDQDCDLVTTHYAHPAGSQLAFYRRLAGWVAEGGSLLVVGHAAHDDDAHDDDAHDDDAHDDDAHDSHGRGAPPHDKHRAADGVTSHDAHHGCEVAPGAPAGQHPHEEPPGSATASAAEIRDLLEGLGWDVVTAAEPVRTTDDGRTLHDVVVRAVRPPRGR